MKGCPHNLHGKANGDRRPSDPRPPRPILDRSPLFASLALHLAAVMSAEPRSPVLAPPQSALVWAASRPERVEPAPHGFPYDENAEAHAAWALLAAGRAPDGAGPPFCGPEAPVDDDPLPRPRPALLPVGLSTDDQPWRDERLLAAGDLHRATSAGCPFRLPLKRTSRPSASHVAPREARRR
jgi:hypothetical protein